MTSICAVRFGVGADYTPGACNIGRAERQARYAFGLVSFSVAAGVAAVAVDLSMPRWVLLLIVVPLVGGFVGYLQGRRGFCVRFAWAGVYNVSDRLSEQVAVSDPEAARRDRRQARSLVVRAGLGAVVVAMALYLLVPI